MTIPRYHIFSGLDEDAAWIEAVDGLLMDVFPVENLFACRPDRAFAEIRSDLEYAPDLEFDHGLLPWAAWRGRMLFRRAQASATSTVLGLRPK